MIKDCSLKNIPKLLLEKLYFKNTCQIVPSKNVFQKHMSNCYHKDIFISASINSVKDKTVF